MAIPTSEVNIIGVHCYAADDLGLVATMTSATTPLESTPITTCVGATVIGISQLSAGGLTLDVDIADSAANLNYGAPSQSVSLSGTGVQAFVQETTDASPWIGFKQTPGGSGFTFDTAAGKQGLKVLVLYERLAGQEWNNVASAINMITSAVNTVTSGNSAAGSGNLPNTFTKGTDIL